jgi:hypothetical protein
MNRIRNILYSFSFYPPNAYGPTGDKRIMDRVWKDVMKKLSAKKFERVTRAEIR